MDRARAADAPRDTASRILDVAERLIQVRGWTGFSYADISEELGIRKASLHHHFPTKAALGDAIIVRYRQAFLEALGKIDRSADAPPAKLSKYTKLYLKVLREGRMCLCGMLAADFETLPTSMREAVTGFFAVNEAWLVKLLEQGRKDGSLSFAGPPRPVAAFLVSALEGAMLMARSYGGVAKLQAVVKKLLNDLGPAKFARRAGRASGEVAGYRA